MVLVLFSRGAGDEGGRAFPEQAHSSSPTRERQFALDHLLPFPVPHLFLRLYEKSSHFENPLNGLLPCLFDAIRPF